MLLEVSATKWDTFSTYLSRANPERFYPSPGKTQITKCTSQALTSQTWTSRRQWASCAHPPPVLHVHQYRHRRVWATPQAGQAPASCGGDGDGGDDGGASLGAAGPAERTIHGAPWRGRSVSRSSFRVALGSAGQEATGGIGIGIVNGTGIGVGIGRRGNTCPNNLHDVHETMASFLARPARPHRLSQIKVRSTFNVQCSMFKVQRSEFRVTVCLSAAFLFVVSFSVSVEARRKRSGYR